MIGAPSVSSETASEEELAQALGSEVACPLCGGTLRRDALSSRPYFVDERNHGYSNVRVLIRELSERGQLPPSMAVYTAESTSRADAVH